MDGRSYPRSPGTLAFDDAGRVASTGPGTRDRRSRSGPGGAVRRDRASHPRAPRARALRRHALHDVAAPTSPATRSPCLPDARTVISAALCYYAPEPDPPKGHGRLPRYTWADHYAALREKLDVLGRELGGGYRVLVDQNQHVDREGGARAGVGFYGKNTLLITRRHGSWVVLGTVVTDVEVEPSPPLELDCGTCRLCIDACPTQAPRGGRHARFDPLPLVLDSVARADPGGVPGPARYSGLWLRHLPGRLPVEPGDREASPRGGAAKASPSRTCPSLSGSSCPRRSS